MKKMTKKIRKAIEDLGWIVKEYDEEYMIEQSSPSGEDLVEYIRKGADVVEQVHEIYNNFDEDEHVEMWVNARHSVSGVPSIRELVQDASDIKEIYENLMLKVCEVA